MYGKATLATVVSKISINAAIETVAAIAQGLTFGRQTTCSKGKVSASEFIVSTLSFRRSCPVETGGHDFPWVPTGGKVPVAFIRESPTH